MASWPNLHIEFYYTLEFQIEDKARKKTGLKKSIRITFIYSFSMQNTRYQLPLCLGIIAVTLAQKLTPFLSRITFFRALASIWSVRVI